ncbi:carbonic anhydrase 4-like [Diadema antillarum]|uniref:carbonic anhydrase 4-like n=1 Tax=Diadema antillarum TaxID=105358 RepID=UPI003A843435
MASHVGPLHWSSSYPKCAGRYQSPIALSSCTAVRESTCNRFCFDGYGKERNLDIKNNGHSVQVTLPSNSYFIKGGGLSGKYQALQFHFHWGSDSTKGSEHSVDGVTYPAEMHIVHRKVGLTADEALQVKDGLAVLSVMIKIGCQTNRNFDAIVKSLSVIPMSGDATTTSGNISLDNLLPDNRQDFFRYYGSLTTPTCDEIVVWTVFADPVEISENQVNSFLYLIYDNERNTVEKTNCLLCCLSSTVLIRDSEMVS